MSDEDDDALARFREAEERIRTTPPRCLAGFQPQPAELPGVRFDGHNQPLNKVFHLRCACGSDHSVALGYPVVNRGVSVFVGPLALRCATCGETTELIDTEIHGYDAELGHGSATVRGKGERQPYACPTCGVEPMVPYVRFEHSDEVLSDSTGEFTGREQDLFSWFSLVGRCDKCQQVITVTDFECA